MRASNKEKRPDLIFEEMDALNMSYDQDSYTAVLDKGTLDALMPDNNQETLDNINRYLQVISNIIARYTLYC